MARRRHVKPVVREIRKERPGARISVLHWHEWGGSYSLDPLPEDTWGEALVNSVRWVESADGNDEMCIIEASW